MINSFSSSVSYTRLQAEYTSFSSNSDRNPKDTANDALLGRLANNVPEMAVKDVKDLSNNEFSADKIAARISNFVAQGLQNARNEGRSEAEIQSKYEAAVKGVERGFAEAREILDNLNLLSDDISSMIGETEDLTFKALEEINPANAQQTDSTALSGNYQVASAERYSKTETFSLDLKTQDGDTVKILFANQSSAQSAFAATSDGNGNSSAVFSLSQSQSSALQFQVQGELDEDELEAINKLIQDVGEISDEFFNGDVQKAFEIATQFQMDKTELASMHLQLTRSQEYSAASSYRSVQNNSAPDIGKLAGHLFNNFDQATQNPALNFLDNVSSISQQILDSLVKQDDRYLEANKEHQDIFDRGLQTIRDVMDSMQQLEQPSA